jgi:hypothetical protein
VSSLQLDITPERSSCKRLALLLVLLVALALPAQARAAWHREMPYQRELLYQRLNLERGFGGEAPLVPGTFDTTLAATTHAMAMYRYAYWSSSLKTSHGTYPIASWLRAFVPAGWVSEIRVYQCHNRPLTAYQVESRIMANYRFASYLLLPFNDRMGIHFHRFYKPSGFWAGKGICRMAVVVLAG